MVSPSLKPDASSYTPPTSRPTPEPLETFFACSLKGLPGSTTLSPSPPNQAPQAPMIFSRSAGVLPALPPV